MKGCRLKNSPVVGAGVWVGVSVNVYVGGMLVSVGVLVRGILVPVGESVMGGVTIGVAVAVPKIASHALSKGLTMINPSSFRN